MPEEDLARILWAATRAPSGSNSQPYRFLVLRDGERARKARAVLGETFRRAWSMKSSGEGWKKGTGTDPGSRKARTVAAMQRFVDTFEEIPVVVLVCALRHRAPNPYEGASVYPACQNLLLAARALGYGSTITVWHPMCEAELREKPFMMLYAEPISPLLFNQDSVDKLLFCAEKGIPVTYPPSPNWPD